MQPSITALLHFEALASRQMQIKLKAIQRQFPNSLTMIAVTRMKGISSKLLKLDQVKDFSSVGLRVKKEILFTALYRIQIFKKWNLSVQSGWGLEP